MISALLSESPATAGTNSAAAASTTTPVQGNYAILVNGMKITVVES